MVDIGGATERLHRSVAVLQLDVNLCEAVKCFCVLRKRCNRILKMLFGFLPMLLVRFFYAQVKFLLGRFWDRESWAARVRAGCLRQAHLYIFGDIRSALAAACLNVLGCRFLNVGTAYPDLITSSRDPVESSAAVSVSRPHILDATEGRNELYSQACRGPVVLLVSD